MSFIYQAEPAFFISDKPAGTHISKNDCICIGVNFINLLIEILYTNRSKLISRFFLAKTAYCSKKQKNKSKVPKEHRMKVAIKTFFPCKSYKNYSEKEIFYR